MAGQRKFLMIAALASLAAPLAGCDSVSGSAGRATPKSPTADPKAVAANIDSLDAVVAAHPSDPEAYNTRGVALAKIGNYDRAIADFSQAMKLDPRNASAYTNRALAERQIGAERRGARRFHPRHRRQPGPRARPISAAPTCFAPRASMTPRSATSTRPSASIRKTPSRFTRAA